MDVTVKIPDRLLPYIEHIPAGLLSESIINAFEKSILESNTEHILAYENNAMLKEVLALLKGYSARPPMTKREAALVEELRESLLGEVPDDRLVNISDYYHAKHSENQNDKVEEKFVPSEPKEIEEVLQNTIGVSETEQEQITVSLPLDDDLGDFLDLMK